MRRVCRLHWLTGLVVLCTLSCSLLLDPDQHKGEGGTQATAVAGRGYTAGTSASSAVTRAGAGIGINGGTRTLGVGGSGGTTAWADSGSVSGDMTIRDDSGSVSGAPGTVDSSVDDSGEVSVRADSGGVAGESGAGGSGDVNARTDSGGFGTNGAACSDHAECASNNCRTDPAGVGTCYGTLSANEACDQDHDCETGYCLPMTIDQANAEGNGGACAPGASTCSEVGLTEACLIFTNLYCAQVQTCGGHSERPDYIDFNYCITTECTDNSENMLTESDCLLFEEGFRSGIVPCF